MATYGNGAPPEIVGANAANAAINSQTGKGAVKRASSRRSDKEFVEKAMSRYDVGQGASLHWRREARRAYNYYENSQRPPEITGYDDVLYVTLNLVRSRVDTKVGILTASKPKADVTARGVEDHEVNAAFKDLLDHSSDEDKIDIRVTQCVSDMVKCGLGVLEEDFNPDKKQYTSHGKAWGKVEANVGDPLLYTIDPSNRDSDFEGKNGADWFFREFRLTTEELLSMYPDKRRELESLLEQANPSQVRGEGEAISGDYQQDVGESVDDSESDKDDHSRYESDPTQRVLDYWYLKDEPVVRIVELDENGAWTPALDERGDALEEIPEEDNGKDYDEIHRIEKTVWNAKMVADILLENKASMYKHGKWPVTFFSGTMHKGDPVPYGEIHNLFDAQDLYNKLMSVTLDNAIRSNNTGWKLEEGAMEPKEEERLQQQGSEPGFIAKTRMGRVEGLQRLESGQLPRGLMELQRDIRTTFDELASIYQTQRGGMPYETSGKAVIALQQAADSALTALQRHIEDALTDWGRKRISNIQQFYTYERAWRISERLKNATSHLVTQLQVPVDQNGVPTSMGSTLHLYRLEDGDPEPKLLLKDWSVPEFDVRFVLGTGHERSRDQKLEEAKFLYEAQAVDTEYLMKAFEVEGYQEITERLDEKNQILSLGQQIAEMMEDETIGPIVEQLMQDPEGLLAQLQAGQQVAAQPQPTNAIPMAQAMGI
jgi:iron uptake system EfeUOB component EfeO/EfeM